eukprot:4813739-Pleurochrysis_carterae.AAC.1
MESAQPLQGVNPESIKGAGAAIASVLSEPCEVDAAAQDASVAVFDSLVSKSSDAGLDEGTSAVLLNGLSSMYEANDVEASRGKQAADTPPEDGADSASGEENGSGGDESGSADDGSGDDGFGSGTKPDDFASG